MVIRSVPDSIIQFQAEPSDQASLLYTARFKSTLVAWERHFNTRATSCLEVSMLVNLHYDSSNLVRHFPYSLNLVWTRANSSAGLHNS